MNSFIENPALFAVLFLSLIISIGIHEFSHVYAAYLQGDNTGKSLGRLTLNPLRHLDPYGTMFMVISLLYGFGIGWGRPAPFNPYNLRFKRWGTFLVAIAGPISNIILVAIFGYAWLAFSRILPDTNLMIMFLQAMTLVNAGLAAFNLLPIPPLDGSRFLGVILGQNSPIVIALERYGFFLLIIVVLFAQSLVSVWVIGGANLIMRLLGLG